MGIARKVEESISGDNSFRPDISPRVAKAVDKHKVVGGFSVEADDLERNVDRNMRKVTQLRVVVVGGIVGALPAESIVHNFAGTCFCHG